MTRRRILKQKLNEARLYTSFGARLRSLRLARHLTPGRFHSLSGIDTDTLRRYEGGVLEPKLTTIMVMAKALEISHLDLMNIDFKADDLLN